MSQFAHLHTHTHYSLLDGLPKVKDFIAAVKKQEEIRCPAQGVLLDKW
ncbi:MAG: hypothetical protein AAB444_01675 [Patescibacteria group bacterium]